MCRVCGGDRLALRAAAVAGDISAALTCQAPADFCHDCRIDLKDFAALAQNWLTTYNLQDLANLSTHWLTSHRSWEQ